MHPGRMKTLRAESFGPENPGLNVAVGHYLFLHQGQTWHSEECIVAPHQDSWHWAADDYRTWRESTPVVEPDGTRYAVPVDANGCGPLHPEWFDRSPGLMAHYDFQYQTGGVVHTYKDIPRLYEEARAFGLNHILLSGWNESGFDYGFPQYRPNPLLGTEEELRDGVQAVIARRRTCGLLCERPAVQYLFPGSGIAVEKRRHPEAGRLAVAGAVRFPQPVFRLHVQSGRAVAERADQHVPLADP